MIHLRPYQAKADAEVVEAWRAGKKRVLLQLPTGGGKCLVKGTPVLMFDGSIKPVEQVQEGDMLMGDDSTPRRVLSTCTGEELCYDIIPIDSMANKWGCNESHILSLKCWATQGRFEKGEVYDIGLREYLALEMAEKAALVQYTSEVDGSAKPKYRFTNILVKERSIEKYYGFEIDGNRRFLLGDFTVTHNTIMFNHRAAIAAQKGFRVLIVADRRELIQQAWSRLWQASGIHGGIIMSGHAPAYMLPVQIASVQTLNRRSFPPDMDIVIIDEARGSVADSYKPIFEFYKDSYFLGVDATPIRANGQGFDHLYDHMVCGPTIKDLEAMGSLVPGKPYINPLDPRLLDKIKLTAGDYNEKELSEMMSNQQMTADLVASKLKFAKGLKTIVFAVSIKHSKLIIEQYRAAGISAAHVDGEMPMAERDAIFKAFKNGKYEVLCNVGIACYGYDEPTIQCVQLARPTKSLALYLQQIGRGTRPLPGKENYILLDHSNCIIEHGLPNTERKWSLKGKKKEKSKPRQFKIKIGNEEKIVSARDFPQQMEGMELQEVDEVTLRMAEFDTMKSFAAERGHKPLSAVYKYIEKYPDCGMLELQYIEKKLNFKSGWWKYKFQELEENRGKQVQK